MKSASIASGLMTSTWRDIMQGDLVRRATHYILERQCKTGGFCFYRLEEPNGADTYFALATLHLLGKKIEDASTLRFLKDAQAPDGTYRSLYQAYYAIKGLEYMGTGPRIDPRPYLREQFHSVVGNATTETALRRLDYLTELCEDLDVAIPSRQRDKMIEFIVGCGNEAGGFGKPVPTLLASAHAIPTLKRLGASVDLSGALRFLKECENPTHGFLNVPKMAPSFIEHVHAGLSISRLLDYSPRYPRACRQFIVRCQDLNGGFARTSHGLPTLADTFLAIHALSMLDESGHRIMAV